MSRRKKRTMLPTYPADTNPFADPALGRRGRPRKGSLPRWEDELVNQRYDAQTWIVDLELVDRVRRDAGEHGYALEQWMVLPDGRIILAFIKKKNRCSPGN